VEEEEEEKKKKKKKKKKKAKVIPVVRGATGTISKSLRQYLNNVTGSAKIYGTSNFPYWELYMYYGKC